VPRFRWNSQRWGRRFLLAGCLLLAWAAVVAATGGFRIEIGALRISSRNATRAALAGTVLSIVAWRLAYRDHVRGAVRSLPRWLARIEGRLASAGAAGRRGAEVAAWLTALALLALAIAYGSRTAGGADAFGYVSEAALLAHRQLAIDQSYAASLPWPAALGSFVPLAYHLGANNRMGPTVAPGLPLLMAAARVFSACGPYLIVPFCGATLVLATFFLGRRLFGASQGLVAATLVASSPTVVFESMVVMADVPAAACWISALTVALRCSGNSTLAAGALSGIAILIRPNLLPLAIFPWLLAVCRSNLWTAGRRTLLFAAGSVPAALIIAFINTRVHGSPLTSGYGDLGGAFALSHAATNARLYWGWWLESQGVAGAIFLAALWPWRAGMRREVVILIAYAVSAVLLYLFYLPFDQWWYLRFLLPAIPIVWLLGADAVAWVTRWSSLGRAAALVALLFTGGMHALHFADEKDLLANSEAERRRYLDAAIYLDTALPRDAVVLAMQHSGSIRYYTGRLTMRWDVLDPVSLDAAVAALSERAVPVYAAIESWEEEDFRRRFAGQRTLNRLAAPLAKSSDEELRVYTLSGDAAGDAAVIIARDAAACVDASPAFVEPAAVGRLSPRPPALTRQSPARSHRD
jgi:hypothetical protein